MPYPPYRACGGQEGCLLLRLIFIPHNALSGLRQENLKFFMFVGLFDLLSIVKVKLAQYAWDSDPNTVWHPTGSGEGAYTTLHLNEVLL